MQTKAVFPLDVSQEGNRPPNWKEMIISHQNICLQRSRTGENPFYNTFQGSIRSINYLILCALLARLEPFRYLNSLILKASELGRLVLWSQLGPHVAYCAANLCSVFTLIITLIIGAPWELNAHSKVMDGTKHKFTNLETQQRKLRLNGTKLEREKWTYKQSDRRGWLRKRESWADAHSVFINKAPSQS